MQGGLKVWEWSKKATRINFPEQKARVQDQAGRGDNESRFFAARPNQKHCADDEQLSGSFEAQKSTPMGAADSIHAALPRILRKGPGKRGSVPRSTLA